MAADRETPGVRGYPGEAMLRLCPRAHPAAVADEQEDHHQAEQEAWPGLPLSPVPG